MFDLPTYRWDPVPQAFDAAAAELDRLALALEMADADTNVPKADGVRLAAANLRQRAARAAREAAADVGVARVGEMLTPHPSGLPAKAGVVFEPEPPGGPEVTTPATPPASEGTPKRFLVFAYNDYYPRGGACDLLHRCQTFEEAYPLAVLALRHNDNAHILDALTGHVRDLDLADYKGTAHPHLMPKPPSDTPVQ